MLNFPLKQNEINFENFLDEDSIEEEKVKPKKKKGKKKKKKKYTV